MRYVSVLILFCLLVALGVQIYALWADGRAGTKEFAALEAELRAREQEQQRLTADAEYVSHPDNLEKELRGRFNYRGKDEKLIIVVPQPPSSSVPSVP
ncbi:MAG: hypothetical protein HY436_01160 [Candidatus Liptonbacteria bacterium]|nr:hypothetical protein [Candidatus Liptonbacteria bacterium]